MFTYWLHLKLVSLLKHYHESCAKRIRFSSGKFQCFCRLKQVLEAKINNAVFEIMDQFGPEQHMVFIGNNSFIAWLVNQHDVEYLRNQLLDCFVHT